MGTGGNLIVGLTGGMGSGKSTAAALFAEMGFTRLDADQVVREVLLTSSDVIAAIRERFGADVIDAAGRVDRAKLGAVVFADDAALAWLEGELHPRLHEHWEKIYATARAERFIVEVPLLFEGGREAVDLLDVEVEAVGVAGGCPQGAFDANVVRLLKRNRHSACDRPLHHASHGPLPR